MAKLQAAPTAAPRIYPVGRAVVLHAFASAELTGRRFLIDGRRISTLRYGRLSVVVGFVDQARYTPDELARQRGDAVWLGGEARVHERAVERSALRAPVVPARLLSVFPHPAALELAVREGYPRWSRALARLGTKREYALHAFIGPHAPPGAQPYVLRVSARATRAGRVTLPKGKDGAMDIVQSLWRDCGALASATRGLQRPAERGALASVTYLVGDGDGAALRERVARASKEGAPLGISFYLEGPRSPFTFV